MSVLDDLILFEEEPIIDAMIETEKLEQAQKEKELKDLMEGLKEKIDKNEPIFIGGMADESPELQMDYVMEKHLERERHEGFMSEEAQKEKELKNFMTWGERMHYWSLLYPLIYRQKAIEKQFSGKNEVISLTLSMLCFVKGEEPIKPIYDSIIAKGGKILSKWKTLNDKIFKIREYQLGKEFKRDVYFPMVVEINEAVKRDLLEVNIPLLYSFTPSDEAIINKVYEDSIPF